MLEDARRRLVETGTRNRLVHVNRANKRAKVLNIINERSDDIYQILRVKGKKMRFAAQGKDKKNAENDETPLLEMIVDDKPFDAARYVDNNLETPLGPDAQQKKLLQLAREAKTAEEEQGVNILYLAMGFLTWHEAKSSAVKREAPLILLPVTLVRNVRTSTFDILSLEDDVVTNLPLQERLKEDFGIDLPEIDEGEGFSPSEYFKQIEPIIENKKGWSLDPNGMQLGFFSFAKFLMLRDLQPENWPDNKLTRHPILQGLLEANYRAESPCFSNEEKLDEILEPADIIQVVDADASQTKVIEEVRKGRDLVVQGPPGTGKSQTITNIIAAAVYDGKRVLFMAEKMAALDVVYKRLVDVGLKNVCLELHSRNANKKAVLGELSRTLNEANAISQMPEPPDKLKDRRDKLNKIAGLIHCQIPGTDKTVFNALSALVALRGKHVPPPEFQNEKLATLPDERIGRLENSIGNLSRAVLKYNNIAQHPYYGTGKLDLSPIDLERFTNSLETAELQLEKLQERTNAIAEELDVERPNSFREVENLDKLTDIIAKTPPHAGDFVHCLMQVSDTARMKEAIEFGVDWAKRRSELKASFSELAFEMDPAHMRPSLIKGTTSLLTRWLSSDYKTNSAELASYLKGPLPKSAQERVALLDVLLDLQQKRRKLADEEGFLQETLGPFWRGEQTNFAAIQPVLHWVLQIFETGLRPSPSALSERTNNPATTSSQNSIADDLLKASSIVQAMIDTLQLDKEKAFQTNELQEAMISKQLANIKSLQTNSDSYDEWRQASIARQDLEDAGLGSIIERIESGELQAQNAIDELHYVRAEALWKRAKTSLPELSGLQDAPRHEWVKEFKDLEAQRIEDVRKLIYAKHTLQLPHGVSGGMQVIRGEIAKRRRHKPLRKLITLSGDAIQRVKPVLLMSPISVAQFLPPGVVEFDLLVIDEASQVRPEDALGAIARTKQVVVVGDQKQLPPTNFFSNLTGNDQDDEDDEGVLAGAARATEMESILSLCEARGVGQRMLEWHYRSRDPSLIRVSNAEFYGNGLVLPPSPLQGDVNYGMKFTKALGAYSSQSKGSGRPQTNKIEAQAVVDALAKHAQQWPDLSVGIVTFSGKQRDMITELIEHARRSDPTLDSFLREGKHEDVFVKNIENVQGDERDVILISVGYGPNEPGGRLPSMNFGPVNRDGGERRLNVLFSRARIRCEVFASFEPGDIDLNRTQKEGPRVLKRYLEFAKTGQLDEKIHTGLDADSPFEEDVASEIRRLGYEVDHQVGSAGFLIDLGVKNPDHTGQYMLAVECDGATYHRALWARERDRLRQGVLEGLGWRFHRIWSTDWFMHREAEIERLDNALRNARDVSEVGTRVKGANEGFEHKPDADETGSVMAATEIPPLELEPINAPPYQITQARIASDQEPHEVYAGSLVETVEQIIVDEGPIHTEEIARRLAAAFGKKKAGKRILEKTREVLRITKPRSELGLVSESDFWWTKEQSEKMPVRDRSETTGTILKAQYIAPAEIQAAAVLIIKESGKVEREELIKSVGHLLGFKRIGSDLYQRISSFLQTV